MGKNKKSFFHIIIDDKIPLLGRSIRKMTMLISDKNYISWQYKRHMNKRINWDNPKTFNEKLQWLKVYWRNPLATKCADKYSVREYIKEKIGSQYLTELIGVYDSVDQIDLKELPEKFVLKATHGSAMNIICSNKSDIDWSHEKSKLNNWLKTNYYYGNREWVYRDIKPRIICEEYLGENIVDYKLYCFNGIPKYWFVAQDRLTGVKADFYELDWEKAPFNWVYPSSESSPSIPENSEEMIRLATILSAPFPFVRVDFYEIEGKIYFGELTFFHGSGFGEYQPVEYNQILGNMIDTKGIKMVNEKFN